MRNDKGQFITGNIPWCSGTKGICKPNKTSFEKGKHYSSKTEFKKGQVPWIAGKHHTEESKIKMSESSKGQITWMKGKKHSLESRNKISIGRKGKCCGKEHPLYGKHHSVSSLEKISRNRSKTKKREKIISEQKY